MIYRLVLALGMLVSLAQAKVCTQTTTTFGGYTSGRKVTAIVGTKDIYVCGGLVTFTGIPTGGTIQFYFAPTGTCPNALPELHFLQYMFVTPQTPQMFQLLGSTSVWHVPAGNDLCVWLSPGGVSTNYTLSYSEQP